MPSFVCLVPAKTSAMAFSRAQKRSLAVGVGLIVAAGLLITLIWAGTYLPGFIGDVFSTIAGIMWTPILLDISLFAMGIVLILWLNSYIRARDGDELVYLEQIEGPDVPEDLPTDARTAVFVEKPESLGLAPALAAIEGALDLQDYTEAADLLFKLPPDSLDEPPVLALRLRLASSQGQEDQVRALQKKLNARSDPRQDHGQHNESTNR